MADRQPSTSSRFQPTPSHPPSRPLKCLACDLWSSNHQLWISHLISEGHQERVRSDGRSDFRHENWRDEAIRDSCLIVSGVKGLSHHSLVAYLSRWGLIIDMIREQKPPERGPPDYFFLQYESQESVLKVLTAQNRAPHHVQGHQIFFRRKYDRAPLRPSATGGNYGVIKPPASSSVAIRGGTTRLHGLGKLASSYRDESESGLGLLQQTYGTEGTGGDMELDTDMEQGAQVQEEHDLFSQKMTEHLAKNLSHLKLEEQLEGFCKNMLLSEHFLQARFKFIQELQGLLQNRYPKCAIYPSGPDYIGIGNSDDAVNVFVDLFDNQLSSVKQPWEESSDQHVPEIFHILKLEQDAHRFCTLLSKVTRQGQPGRIPTITLTFVHLESQIKCKLQTHNFPMVQESMLTKFLCTLDVRVRPLLILVRSWSSFNKIFDGPDEDMRNRVVILLMLFHLANRKIIPTLSHLQSMERPKMIWKNLDISFCGSNKVPPNNMKMLEDKSIRTLSIFSMLKDFFERFGVASLKDNAVCLWPGKFIEKTQLKPGKEDSLPEDFAKKLRIGPNGDIIMKSVDTKTPMCVQDLFDMTLNLTGNIGAEEVKSFQMLCWKTSEKIEEVMNSDRPYLMDIFIGSTTDLISTSSTSGIGAELVSDSDSVIVMEDAGLEVDATKQGTMAIEWEEFSRSLQKPTRPLSFLTKPVAPISPVTRVSPKGYNHLPNPLYGQPGQRFQYSQIAHGAVVSTIQSVPPVAKPPLRYQPPNVEITVGQSVSGNCEESDEDSSESSDGEDEDDDEGEEIQLAALMGSSLSKPMTMSKVKLSNSTKALFLKAVQKHEFSYGGRGKMQSLWLQFLKIFNVQFWKCFGLAMELDPSYQDVTGAEYANFNNNNDSRRPTLAQKLECVPNYEEPYTCSFYCQSQRLMNRVLCARKNDFINTKYIRRQLQSLLKILMGEGQSDLSGHFQPISSEESLSFKCRFIVILDYQDLHSDCTPSAQLVFDKGVSGYGHLNQLHFLGKVFEKMAAQFIDRCFKSWLASCQDFDLKSALRNQMMEKQERGRLANLSRKGKLSKRKVQKKARKALARALAKSGTFREHDEGQGEVYGAGQVQDGVNLGHGPRGQSQVRGGSQGRKSFQVPASWNRSLEFQNPRGGRGGSGRRY